MIFGKLNKLALWLSWLAVPGLLAGILSPVLASVWPGLDVLSHLAVHCALLLVAVLIAIWFRRWFIAVFSVAVLLGGMGAFGLPIWQQKYQPAVSADLSVLSFNTHGWANTDLARIEAMLRAEQADIVVLLEFTGKQVPLLARLRALYPHQAECSGHGLCRMALLSRYPLRDVRLAARDYQKRSPTLARAIVSLPRGDINFLGVHLTRPFDPFDQRNELGFISTLVRGWSEFEVIVAGDFNSVPWSFNMREFQMVSGLKCLNRFTHTWPMQPLGLAQFPIDQVCASKDLKPSGFYAGGATGSDHRPVVARLRF